VLFRSLQQELPVHQFDVQCAIDSCDNEAVMEINISDFLRRVCAHLKPSPSSVVVGGHGGSSSSPGRSPNNTLHAANGSSPSAALMDNREEDTKTPTGDVVSIINDETEDATAAAVEVTADDDNDSGMKLPMENVSGIKTCSTLFENHPGIKKKFKDLLQNSFRLVNTWNNVYFYCPAAASVSDEMLMFGASGGSVSRQRRDTRDTTASFENETGNANANGSNNANNMEGLSDFSKLRMMQLNSSKSGGGGGSQIQPKSETPSEQSYPVGAGTGLGGGGSLSMLSNAASEQLDLESRAGDEEEEEPIDDTDLPPLFMQVSITVREGRKSMKTFSIKNLPTCIFDLAKDSPTCCYDILSAEAGAIGGGSGGGGSLNDYIKELDLDDLQVTLDLVCMSLPGEMTVTENLSRHGSTRHISVNSNLSNPQDQNKASVSSYSSLLDASNGNLMVGEDKLPPVQSEVMTALVKDIEWVLQDEIAFALIREQPPNQETLQRVTSHVEASSKKSGCACHTIPLDFVFGNAKSLPIFMRGLPNLTPGGFNLCKLGDYFLLLQQQQQLKPSAAAAAADQQQLSQLASRQLSPVKEILMVGGSQTPTGEMMAGLSPPVPESCLRMMPPPFQMCNDPQLQVGDEGNDSRPNFWLIMEVKEAMVKVYFQYREGQFEAVLPWRQAHQSLVADVRHLCKRVNQQLLLEDLLETRVCSKLLDAGEEVWFDGEEPQAAATINGGICSLDPDLFAPGQFQCQVVWQVEFPIHPRLLQVTHGAKPVSLAMYTFQRTLEIFLVSNRENLYVYKDNKNGAIYCIKLYEKLAAKPATSSTSAAAVRNDAAAVPAFSRSSSISSSLNSSAVMNRQPLKKHHTSPLKHTLHQQQQQQYQENNMESSMGSSAFSATQAPLPPQQQTQQQGNKLVFKVHGLQPITDEFKSDFIGMLENKLTEKLVEVLYVMVQRKNKLTPEDVRFIQPRPNESGGGAKPNLTLRLRLDKGVCHRAFRYYLKQHLTHEMCSRPKFVSSDEAYFHDQDDDDDEAKAGMDANGGQSDIFVYSSTRGKSEVACLAMAIFSPSSAVKQETTTSKQPLSLDSMKEMCQAKKLGEKDVVEDEDAGGGGGGMVRFRAWSRGKLDLEHLEKFLTNCVRNALWDFVMEAHILPQDLTTTTTTASPEGGGSSTDNLSSVYSDLLLKWFEEATSGSPTVSKQTVRFTGRPSKSVIHDLQHQISVAIPDLKSKVFQQVTSNRQRSEEGHEECETSKSYVPRTRFGSSVDGSLNNQQFTAGNEFVVISRNFKQWEAYHNKDQKFEDFAPSSHQLKSLQYFQPRYTQEQLQYFAASSPGGGGSAMAMADNSALYKTSNPSSKCVSPSQPSTPTHRMSLDASFGSTEGGGGAATNSGLAPVSLSSSSSPTSFIARQHLVYTRICYDRKCIDIAMYNVTKDCQERLVKASHDLCHWVTARSTLAESIVAQKLGLFYNQPFFRRSLKQLSVKGGATSNPFAGRIDLAKQLIKSSAPPQAKRSSSSSVVVNAEVDSFKNTYRDTQPPKPLQSSAYSINRDSIGRQGQQLLEVQKVDKKHVMRNLSLVWQQHQSVGHGGRAFFTPEAVEHFKVIGALDHWTFAPLMFLPHYRHLALALKDKFKDEKPSSQEQLNRALQEISSPDFKVTLDQKHDHTALIKSFLQEYTSYLETWGFKLIKSHHSSSSGASTPSSSQQASPSMTAKRKLYANLNISRAASHQMSHRHSTANTAFASSSSLMSSRSSSTASLLSKDGGGVEPSDGGNRVHFYRAATGGLLMIEVSVCPPHVHAKLFSLELTKLDKGPAASFSLTESGELRAVAQLHNDAQDMKTNLRLNSFIHDFQLRTCHSQISAHFASNSTGSYSMATPSGVASGASLSSGGNLLRKGFHLSGFLEDFARYHTPKSPVFAHNFLSKETVRIPIVKKLAPARLFDYILHDSNLFKFKAAKMEPNASSMNSSSSSNNCANYVGGGCVNNGMQFEGSGGGSSGDQQYALVRQCVYQFSHEGPTRDMAKVEEFNASLVVVHRPEVVDVGGGPPPLQNAIDLQYFLVLTSRLKKSPKHHDLEMGGGSPTTTTSQQENQQPHHQQQSRQKRPTSMLVVKSTSKQLSLATNPANSRIKIQDVDEEGSLTDVTDGLRVSPPSLLHPGELRQSTGAVLRMLMATANQMLVHTFAFAAIRCRRDDLWQRLVQMEEKTLHRQQLTLSELGELLSMVKIQKLEGAGDCFKRLAQANFNPKEFVQTMVGVLQSSYPGQHRVFSSDDGMLKHVLIKQQLHQQLPVKKAFASGGGTKNGRGSMTASTGANAAPCPCCCCTMVVADLRVGKISVSLVSKDSAAGVTEAAEAAAAAGRDDFDERAVHQAQEFIRDTCFQLWQKLLFK